MTRNVTDSTPGSYPPPVTCLQLCTIRACKCGPKCFLVDSHVSCDGQLTQLSACMAKTRRLYSATHFPEQIMSHMQVLAPQIALQLIGRGKQPEQRQRGVRMLSDVLWKDGNPVQGYPVLKLGRGQYLHLVQAELTAAEQVLLPQ